MFSLDLGGSVPWSFIEVRAATEMLLPTLAKQPGPALHPPGVTPQEVQPSVESLADKWLDITFTESAATASQQSLQAKRLNLLAQHARTGTCRACSGKRRSVPTTGRPFALG